MPVRRRTDQLGSGPAPWIVDLRVEGLGRRRRILPGTLGRREALAVERAWKQELEAEARAAAAGERHPDSLEQVFARYWAEHGRHLASLTSERAYLSAWAAALGPAQPLATLPVERIAAAAAGWRGQVGDSTINRRLSCLQRIFRRAEDLWGLAVPRVPWRRLRLPEPDHGDRSIRPEHRQAFAAALPERTARLFRLMLLTGLRRGAALRLTAEDVDREARVIRTWSKGKAGGRFTPVPVTPAVAELLAALPQQGRLFPGLTNTMIRRDVDKARAATGLAGMVLGRARHSFAQDLEDAGLGDVITAALHHSDPRLRRRYAQVRLDQVRAAVETAQQRRKLP